MTDNVILDTSKVDGDSPKVGVDVNQSGASNNLANMRCLLQRDAHLREVWTRIQDPDYAVGGLTTDRIQPEGFDAFTGPSTVDPARLNQCGGTDAASAGATPNGGIYATLPDADDAPGQLSTLKLFAIVSFSTGFVFRGTDAGGTFPETEVSLIEWATSGWVVDSGFPIWSETVALTAGNPTDWEVLFNVQYTGAGAAGLLVTANVDSVSSGADVAIHVTGRIAVWVPS